MSPDDTIAALASAPGPAPRGIIRLSGPDVASTVARVFDASSNLHWQSLRTAASIPGRIHLANSVTLPANLLLWPTRRSYTGEPLAEFHTVGSPPLLEAILEALFARGTRPARPGEFTLRAFLAGRIDLAQAEAVLGVIDAPDHAKLETALHQLAGGLSHKLGAIRSNLLNLLADLEAGLDFVDEDIEFVSHEDVLERLDSARRTIDTLFQNAADRMRTTTRPRVVLVGPPNAGKSTLFNSLAGRDAAIVSPIAGTTRDWLRAEIDCAGLPIELVDTAGWDDERNTISDEARRQRTELAREADLVLWCVASDEGETPPADADAPGTESSSAHGNELRIRTKSDLSTPSNLRSAEGVLAVSAQTGDGLQDLLQAIRSRLSGGERRREFVGSTAARSRESLSTASAALLRAAEAAHAVAGDEFIALEIRSALDALGSILGVVYTDDILDRVFSRFCIGK